MSSPSRVFRQDDVTGTDFSALAISSGDCSTTGDHDHPLLPWGKVRVRLPAGGILWLFNEHNSAARERAGYEERGNALYSTCQSPCQFDILKSRGSILPGVNPQVSHVVISESNLLVPQCISAAPHAVDLHGPEVYAIFGRMGS